MSEIWSNDDAKERILLLSPTLQESFLRAVDAIHSRESTSMLTFIQESRHELLDTHQEIVREQEVLRDTSDLLASKRMYGEPDEWEENIHEMNAVDEYLKKRNQGLIGGLGFLSYENEQKSHKKAKKKDKEKHKNAKERPHSHGGELFKSEDSDDQEEKKKKDKKHKKHKDKEEEEDVGHKEKKRKDKDKDKNMDNHRMKREKSAPVIMVADQKDIEKETKDLMQEFITRQTSDLDQKSQFEEALKRKLAKKKNPHAAEADALLKQQAWADEAMVKEKAAYEAKLMEKLKARKEKSNLTKEMSSLEDKSVISEDLEGKPKKDKKKKKNKEKDEEEAGDDNENVGKNKHKKKDKDVSGDPADGDDYDDGKSEKRKHKKKDKDASGDPAEDGNDEKAERKKHKKKDKDGSGDNADDDDDNEKAEKKKHKKKDKTKEDSGDDEKSEKKKKKDGEEKKKKKKDKDKDGDND